MLLGIDQGTTGTRACLVDRDGRIVARAYRTHRQLVPQPGWVEHDLDEIWANTQAVIAEVIPHGKPDGIAIANQGETIGVWLDRDGYHRATGVSKPTAALHNAVVWQDTRTAGSMAALATDSAFADLVRDATGLRLDPYFSAPKLRWLLDHVPGADGLADIGMRAGTIDTWLIDRLTDGAVFATDASTAARTLLCETRTCSWDPRLLSRFGIPRQILPEIRDTDAGFGTCTLPGLEGVPIVASLVDQPASLAGHGCIDRGDAKATFGTGCFVYVNTGSERPIGTETLATVAWRSDAAGWNAMRGTTYALDGGVLSVGSAIDWLRELGIDLPAAGNVIRRDRGVVCVPALVGLGAPYWDRDARAAWLGMSSATSGEDLAGALIEGIACRVAEVIEAIQRDASASAGMADGASASGASGGSFTIRELRVDGGLTRSPMIMQMHADLLGTPIEVAEEDEATVTGACALAAIQLGELTIDQLRERRSRTSARYEPAISADERGHRRDRFARALDAARSFR